MSLKGVSVRRGAIATTRAAAGSAIVFVDSAAQVAASLSSMPTHQAGDLLVIWSFNRDSATLPSEPAGWTTPTGGTLGGNNCGARLTYKVAASGSETSGDYGSQTDHLICHVYRGATGIGDVEIFGAQQSTAIFPALTLENTSGSSWVAGFCSRRSSVDDPTPPTGMVFRDKAVDTHTGFSYDTDGGVASWSEQQHVFASAVGFKSATVEIKA